MSDDQPNKENEVTPDGAVEVDEKALDQAAGGMSSGGDYVENETAGWNGPITLDKASQKSVPQELAGGGGPHVVEKKLGGS